MKTKIDKKHAFLVLFVVALTVFALTGVCSADSQSFYFHDTTYGNTPAIDGTSHACDEDMDKNTGGSGSTVTINSTATAWWYDFAAQVNSTFGEGKWGAEIFYNSTGAGTVYVDIYLVQDDGTIIKNIASGSDSTVDSTPVTYELFECPDNTTTNQTFNVSERLATRVSYSGAGDFIIHYDGTDEHTHINSPPTDPGWPVPELSTILLMSIGLLALMGYVVYRRRNNK